MTDDTDDTDDRWPAAGRFAVDVVMFTGRGDELAVLTVERAKDPFVAALALPGGFVEPGERAPDAAVRELAEETGIAISRKHLQRLACYQAPGRDPRGRVVTVAYHGYLSGAPTVVGGGDARTARWVDVSDFLTSRVQVAFDHRDIVADALSRRFGWRPGSVGSRLAPSPRPSPDSFGS